MKKRTSNIRWIKGEKTPVNQFMTMAGSRCGVTEQEIFDLRQKRLSMYITLWHVCNKYIHENLGTGNFENLISLYFYMSCAQLSKGKPTAQIMRRYFYFKLLQMKKDNNIFVTIISGHNACPACKKLDGKEIYIDEAIKTQPLPPLDCTCKRCSCQY